MIILICTVCLEAFSIHGDREKSCHCGKSFGQYEEDSIRVSPYALPVGVSNHSIQRGRRLRPDSGWGRVLEALVLPHKPMEFQIIIDHKNLRKEAQGESD